MSDVTIAIIVFVATYMVIISERLDRTVVALAGAALMIAFGVLDQAGAVEAIDFNTLALLIGMMIIVGVLRETGVFRYAGWRAARMVNGNPWRLLVAFVLITAFSSAFLDNVTTILLMVPVTMAICSDLGLNVRPFLIGEIIASNVGGTATLIGDPPNILIGSATGLDFVDFLTNLGPLVLGLLPVTIAALWLVYGRRGALGTLAPETTAILDESHQHRHITDERLLRHSGTVLILTIAGFVLHGLLHLEAGSIAMFGAITLLLISKVDPHKVLAQVEWPTIFFFVGLFILVGGIEEIGLLDTIARETVELTSGNLVLTALLLLWLAAIISAIVDNIPAVATMIPLTSSMARILFPEFAGLDEAALALRPEIAPLWWSLAVGACLGGNGSLVGASANVVAVGMAESRGTRIGFWGFTRVGLPFTLVTHVVASVYIYVRYLA